MKEFYHTLKKIIQQYYFHQFYQDSKNFQRSFIVGCLLLLFRQILYLFLMCNGFVINQLLILDSNFKDLPQLKLTNMDYSHMWVVYLSSAFLGLTMLLFIISISAFRLNLKAPYSRALLGFISMSYNYLFFLPILSLNIAMKNINSFSIVNVIFSIIFSKIKNEVFNLILFEIKGILFASHDQDYRVIAQDELSKRSPLLWDCVMILIEIIHCFLSALVKQEEIILIISVILGAYRIIHNFQNLQWNNLTIRFLETFLAIFHTLVVSTLLLSIFRNKQYAISFLVILWIPLSAQSSYYIEKYLQDFQRMPWMSPKSFNKNEFSSISVYQIDQYLRILWRKLPSQIEDYKRSKISVILETLIFNHINQCELSQCAICISNSYSSKIDSSYIEGVHRLNSVKSFIIEQYQQLIGIATSLKQAKKDENKFAHSSIFFSYIHFLAEIQQSKILSFVEMIRIKKRQKLSLREVMFLEEVNRNVCSQFENQKIGEAKSKQQIDESSDNLIIEIYKKKQLRDEIDVDNQNYLLGIKFEEELNQAEDEYLIALKMKEKILIMLTHDNLNLIEIKNNSIKAMEQREKVKQILKQLVQIHNSSPKLQFYIDNYITYLGFADKKDRIFRKKSRFLKKNFFNDNNDDFDFNQNNKTKLDMSIFSKDSCVVFITLIDDLGAIRKMQNRFERLFGMNSKEALGKNISLLMPSIIGKYHNKILIKFIQQTNTKKMSQYENLNQSSQDAEENNKNFMNSNASNILKRSNHRPSTFPLLLARNYKGWAIPVQLNFKVDSLKLNDCGLTGHIKIINKEFLYIMTNCKQFQIQLMSQLFFERVLSKYVEQSETYRIYLNRIIPILPYFEKAYVLDKSKSGQLSKDLIKTIAFFPKSETTLNGMNNQQAPSTRKSQGNPLFEKLEINKLQKEMKKYSIEYYDLYQIKLKFYHNSNEYTSFNVVEIQSMSRIHTPNTQKDALILLKNQLKSLLEVEYDPSEDIKILLKLEELSYYQFHTSSNEYMSMSKYLLQQYLFKIIIHVFIEFQHFKSGTGFEEEISNQNMEDESEKSESDYEQRTHSRIEGKDQFGKQLKQVDSIDQQASKQQKNKYSSLQFQQYPSQSKGEVIQFEESGPLFSGSHQEGGEISRQVEISGRSRLNSVGFDLSNLSMQEQINEEKYNNVYTHIQSENKLGLKTFSTIPLGGEAMNLNQSTFFDTIRGGHLDKESMQDISISKNETSINKKDLSINRNDHSGMKQQISQDKQLDSYDEKFELIPERKSFLQMKYKEEKLKERNKNHTPSHSIKKIDSAMSLISNNTNNQMSDINQLNIKNTTKEHHKNFVSFSVVPMLSNLQVTNEIIGESDINNNNQTNTIPISQLNLIQPAFSHQDSLSPHRKQSISSFMALNHQQQLIQQHHHTHNYTNLQISTQDQKFPHSMIQMHTVSNLQSAENGILNQKQHSSYNTMAFNSPISQLNQYQSLIIQSQPNSPSPIYSPNITPTSNLIYQSQTQAPSTIFVLEKPKGILPLLQERLIELKKQKKQKSTINETTIAGEDQTDIWSQKNNLQFKQASKQLSTNPSLALNNTLSKENSQYLQSFLRSYYDSQQGSAYIIGNKKKNSHLNWRTHDESIESPTQKRLGMIDEGSSKKNQIFGQIAKSSDLPSRSNGEDQDVERRSKSNKLDRMVTNSVNSSQATSKEHQQMIKKLIVSTKGRDSSLIQLRLFGFLAILAIIILTIVQYYSTSQLFEEVKIHINNIPWSNSIRASYAFPVTYMTLKTILEVNGFNDESLYSTEFGEILQSRSIKYNEQTISLLKDLQTQGSEGKNYFHYVVENITTFSFSQDDSTLPESDLYLKEEKYKSALRVRLLSFLQTYISFNLQGFNKQYKDSMSQKFVIDNFPTFISNMTQVQQIVQDQSQQVINQIFSLVKLLLVLVTSVSFTLIFMIFPLYYFVQHKNESVLKLLATITPLSLHQMIRQVSYGMRMFSVEQFYSGNNGYKQFSEKQVKFKNDNVSKKKNISNTTSITKFKVIHLILGMIAFGLISIQPVVAIILTNQFLDQASLNITLLGELYNMIAHSASNMVVSYHYIQHKLVASPKTYNPSYYLARAKTIVTQNSEVLEQISQIIQTSSSQTYRQQYLYDNFLYPMLNKNMCTALANFPQYVQSSSLNVSTCSEISSGIMMSGFQISMKKFYSTFYDLLEIFVMEESQIIPSLLDWEKQINIRDFDLFAEFLMQSIKVQKDFLVLIMSEDIDYIITVAIMLLAFQIFLLGIIFSYIWLKIYHFISIEMHTIRNILTLLNIEVIIDNPYFISHLTK